MKIVITMGLRQYIDECLKDIKDKYPNIIIGYDRMLDTIRLFNGDIIRGYSLNSITRGGIRADVAIGLETEHLTRRSKIDEPVWTIEKLHEYLDKLINIDEEM